MSWYLTFTEDLPSWASGLMGFLSPDEPSNLRVTGPYAERSELGLYSRQLAAPDAEALRRIVEGTGYAALATSDTVAPDTPTLTIGRGARETDPVPRLVGFPLPAMPAALVPAREAIHRWAHEMLDHPQSVVRGAAAWTEATFKPKGPLGLVLTLSNPGAGPVEIRSPDAPDEPASLILTLARTSRPDEAEQVEVLPKEIVRVDDAGNKLAPSDWIQLAPGASARFRVKRKVYLSAGNHRGTVTLRAEPADGSPPEQAYGVLLVKAGGFDVKGWW